MLYRLFITCLISLLTGVISYAQSRLNGVVTDESKVPVAGCITKISLGDKIIAYTITNSKGQYSINFNSNSPQVNIGAECMGYESVYRTLSAESKVCNFVLKENVTVLKEVVVKAPAIYTRGDTLSYQLSGFVTRGDYTLKDAIKKLPGIDVAESGTIKYMGKEISAFYIDGLNLLGGRYGIATNNIPASYVNSVQVLNNHSDVKIDKDMFSNDVAINIKLSNKAKFKPIGKYEAKIGYGDKLLYGIGGAGMLFINADISYSNSNNNLLSHSKVSNKKIETEYLNIPNNSDDITCNIGITKQFTAIATKISINGSYRCGRQLAAQNESVMDLAFQNLSLYPSINAKPCKYVEMEYSGTLSRFFTKYSGINASYLSQKHNVVLKVSPIELLQFSANLEVSKEELSKGSFKTFSLLDAGLQYKHKSLKIVFDVRNIFNYRSYSYTIYNSINTYSYNYRLRGREVILSAVFTI